MQGHLQINCYLRSRVLQSVVVMLLVSFTAFTLGCRKQPSPSTSVESQLQRAAGEVNKMCPMNADEYTRLDKAEAGPGKKLTYYYTLLTDRLDEVGLGKNKFVEVIKPLIIDSLKKQDVSALCRKEGVSLVYVYRTKSGAKHATITILPEEMTVSPFQGGQRTP